MTPVVALPPTNSTELPALDGAHGDLFGRSMEVSGDTAVVGAYSDDDNGESSGAAYVFVRDSSDNWSQQAKLIASDGAMADRFGYSVSISGDTAVIGAYWDDDNGRESGSAYVFVRDGTGSWSQQAKLTASDGATNDRFGSSVSVSDDTALIGAYYDIERYGDNKTRRGSAYVYVHDAAGHWSQQAKLSASDGTTSDLFGQSVSVSGDTALIGARGIRNAGAAYVYARGRSGHWTEQAKLTASDGAADDYFGWSVSLDWDTAVIGAYKDDNNGTDSGSAYVFVRDAYGNWAEEAKLTASDGGSRDRFGFSVSVLGKTAVIGADKRAAGLVYVFVRDGPGNWTEKENLTAADGAGRK